MGGEREYLIVLDRYEREALIAALQQKRGELAAEDLPTDTVDGILERIEHIPAKRRMLVGRRQYGLRLNTAEKRTAVCAITDGHTLHPSECSDEVCHSVLDKIIGARPPGGEADGT